MGADRALLGRSQMQAYVETLIDLLLEAAKEVPTTVRMVAPPPLRQQLGGGRFVFDSGTVHGVPFVLPPRQVVDQGR